MWWPPRRIESKVSRSCEAPHIIGLGNLLRATARLRRGSFIEDNINNAFAVAEIRMQQVQAALADEQTCAAPLERKLRGGGACGDPGGLAGTNRKGWMRGLVPISRTTSGHRAVSSYGPDLSNTSSIRTTVGRSPS